MPRIVFVPSFSVRYVQAKRRDCMRTVRKDITQTRYNQDATSAARLMEALQTHPPGVFYGRHLRFEPARGFRTLLISYR